MFPITSNYLEAVGPCVAKLDGAGQKAALVGSAIGCSLSGAADLAVGTLAFIGSVLTAGTAPTLNRKATEISAMGSAGLLGLPYNFLLLAINPNAESENSTTGIVATGVKDKILQTAHELSGSDNVIKKHIFSRMAFFSFSLMAIATRVADLVIGLLAAPLSLIACGRSKRLNTWAQVGLSAPIGISEFLMGLVKTINPSATSSNQ